MRLSYKKRLPKTAPRDDAKIDLFSTLYAALDTTFEVTLADGRSATLGDAHRSSSPETHSTKEERDKKRTTALFLPRSFLRLAIWDASVGRPPPTPGSCRANRQQSNALFDERAAKTPRGRKPRGERPALETLERDQYLKTSYPNPFNRANR